MSEANQSGPVAKKAAPKKPAKAPAKPLPHQLTAKAQGLAQPQEGGSFIRMPDTKELVKQEPPADAVDISLPADLVSKPEGTNTDTSDAATNGASQQGN